MGSSTFECDREKDGDVGMRPEYDFTGGVRGKYAARFSRGCTVLVLDPDVAEHLPDASSVNETLREVMTRRRRGSVHG